MAIATREATIEDLYRVPEDGKAEIVNGELILMPATGFMPGYAADEIYVSLRQYAGQTSTGWAVADNKGFVVNLPRRKSFNPDAAYYVGPNPGMRFFNGAPVFAVEVRSENDHGEAAEEAMQRKRADYFAAGTVAVWNVDLVGPDTVRAFRADAAPNVPQIFRRGATAHAEPAVPG